MESRVRTQKELKDRWMELVGRRKTLESYSEEYARWTLPYIFPSTESESVELQLSKDSIGAQAVNHLANKVVSTLFPPQRMFFRLTLDETMKKQAEEAVVQAGMDQESAKEAVVQALKVLEQQLASTERQVSDLMDIVQYRPQAVNAAKLLIITGNALEYHPADGPVIVYNLRNYCVLRDLSGEVIEIMTKECKSFETFHPSVQEQIRALKPRDQHSYKRADNIDIYTRVVLEDDGRYHVYQAADKIPLNTEGAFYTKKELPWIPLTWNLIQGEDYGRGLVAEYAGAFHAVNVLSGSLLNIAAVMGDIKFFVDPQSLIDVPALNASAPGSYHSGRPDQVGMMSNASKLADAQFISTMIERYERQISQAFLLNSQLTRQAERVTAEEIRMQANELETSNGGIYSRLAATWQGQLANVLLTQTGFDGLDYGITPKIITGMDSLSRQSELDNIVQWLSYMGLLQNVPEDVRATIDLRSFAELVGTNLQVEYQKFVKTQQQMQAEQQAAMQQQQELENMQADREGRVAASREAVKEL
ncbi:collar protein [Agrobacterium phage Atu_ph03]|uniref:Collar protein n=1 Tax=Agrobacterium phage Atu_ph03 TaxID=2024262 RepID=A0A223VZJ3_9CAUD|nr:collar protein [Agrobacterium phage Atu_ph03]ASV44582.1 collar protein [Agrobacterium phage Atu_ph03]